MLDDDNKFWRFVFIKTEEGTLKFKCNENGQNHTVCGTSCGYMLLDIDRISLSRDFGQGKVRYLQQHKGKSKSVRQ